MNHQENKQSFLEKLMHPTREEIEYIIKTNGKPIKLVDVVRIVDRDEKND